MCAQKDITMDEICSTPSSSPNPIAATRRNSLIRQVFYLEGITIAWIIIEAAVALVSGIIASSITLIAFGADSLIELISAIVLVWRMSVELRRGQAFSEQAERTARRIGAALLFTLAAYVVSAAGWSLWTRQGEEFSLSGLVVSSIAIPTMYYLARRKLALAEILGSRALRADAMEAITCGWLSFVVVIGLAAEAVFGVWWIDAVTSLGIVWFLVREGSEAWKDEGCCCH